MLLLLYGNLVFVNSWKFSFRSGLPTELIEVALIGQMTTFKQSSLLNNQIG